MPCILNPGSMLSALLCICRVLFITNYSLACCKHFSSLVDLEKETRLARAHTFSVFEISNAL